MVKMVLGASKKAITKNCGKITPSTKDKWLIIVEEIFLMEQLTYPETTRSSTGRKMEKMDYRQDSKCRHWNGTVNKLTYKTLEI